MSHIVTPREAAAWLSTAAARAGAATVRAATVRYPPRPLPLPDSRERGRMNEYTRKPGRIGVFLVARIPALRPDVAVLDVRRPDGSGISVCRESAPRAVLPADQARHAAPHPKPPPSPHATPTTTTTTMTDPRLTTQDTDHPQRPQGRPAPAQIPPHLNADRPGLAANPAGARRVPAGSNPAGSLRPDRPPLVPPTRPAARERGQLAALTVINRGWAEWPGLNGPGRKDWANDLP